MPLEAQPQADVAAPGEFERGRTRDGRDVPVNVRRFDRCAARGSMLVTAFERARDASVASQVTPRIGAGK